MLSSMAEYRRVVTYMVISVRVCVCVCTYTSMCVYICCLSMSAYVLCVCVCVCVCVCWAEKEQGHELERSFLRDDYHAAALSIAAVDLLLGLQHRSQ